MGLARRTYYYLGFFVVFLGLYGGVVLVLEGFPDRLLFGVLLLSLAKDVVDEYLIWLGDKPVAYGRIEHNPSNLVLLLFLASGVVEPAGTVLGAPARGVAAALAFLDLALDGSQDLRHWR